MAIVNSGALSLGTTAGANRSITAEFGGSGQHALSEYYAGGPFVPSGAPGIPSAGEIKFSDFYGAANVFSTTITVGEYVQSATLTYRGYSLAGRINAGSPAFGASSSIDVFGADLEAAYITLLGLSQTLSGFVIILEGSRPQSYFSSVDVVLNSIDGPINFTSASADGFDDLGTRTRWTWIPPGTHDWSVSAQRSIVINPPP